jgi:probable rRNA maturation factor
VIGSRRGGPACPPCFCAGRADTQVRPYKMIEVVNRQRRRKIDTAAWQAQAEKALTLIGSSGDATIAFISDRRMRGLNRTFRHLDKTTDVLSFPATRDEFADSAANNLGDLAISVERAEQQAEENKLEFDQEIAQLILHGLLHLCGYDHETDNGEMNRLELRLRRRLGI